MSNTDTRVNDRSLQTICEALRTIADHGLAACIAYLVQEGLRGARERGRVPEPQTTEGRCEGRLRPEQRDIVSAWDAHGDIEALRAMSLHVMSTLDSVPAAMCLSEALDRMFDCARELRRARDGGGQGPTIGP